MTDTQPPTPDLDTIQASASVATDGPWGHWPAKDSDGLIVIGDLDTPDDEANAVAHIYVMEDAIFIARARTDVPALIAYARHLEARAASLEQQLAAVSQWVASTHHGAAAAEVGRIVHVAPRPVQYCGYCGRPHLDCTC